MSFVYIDLVSGISSLSLPDNPDLSAIIAARKQRLHLLPDIGTLLAVLGGNEPTQRNQMTWPWAFKDLEYQMLE